MAAALPAVLPMQLRADDTPQQPQACNIPAEVSAELDAELQVLAAELKASLTEAQRAQVCVGVSGWHDPGGLIATGVTFIYVYVWECQSPAAPAACR